MKLLVIDQSNISAPATPNCMWWFLKVFRWISQEIMVFQILKRCYFHFGDSYMVVFVPSLRRFLPPTCIAFAFARIVAGLSHYTNMFFFYSYQRTQLMFCGWQNVKGFRLSCSFYEELYLYVIKIQNASRFPGIARRKIIRGWLANRGASDHRFYWPQWATEQLKWIWLRGKLCFVWVVFDCGQRGMICVAKVHNTLHIRFCVAFQKSSFHFQNITDAASFFSDRAQT